MKKYHYLDNRGRRTISAAGDMGPDVDTAIAFLVEFWNVSVSMAICIATVNYARVMRGLDLEQAAAVMALARWLTWFVNDNQ